MGRAPARVNAPVPERALLKETVRVELLVSVRSAFRMNGAERVTVPLATVLATVKKAGPEDVWKVRLPVPEAAWL